MTQSKILTEDQVKKLHQLENMALMLDKGCRAGELDNSDIEKAGAILNKISESLMTDKDVIGTRLYIVYENQAMLSWIDKKVDEAHRLAEIAKETKGDGDLLTKTANDLINTATNEVAKSTTESDKKLVGLNGWLAWFVVGLVIATLYNFFNSISGFSDTSVYTAEILDMYPNLPTFINFENLAILLIAIFGVFLLVSIMRLKKNSIKAAIGYSVAVITFELIDIFVAYSMFANNKAIVDSIFSDGKIIRAILFSFIWLLYFVFSKRVRQTFTKE